MSTSELPRINELVGAHDPLAAPRPDRQPANESLVWTAAAPDKVLERSRSGDEDQTWLPWRKYLARRTSPLAGTPFDKLGSAQMLLWGLSEQHADCELLAVITNYGEDRTSNHERQATLDDFIANGPAALDERATLGLLACAYELPTLATRLSKQVWWKLLGRLRQTALDAAALELSTTPLLHQRLAGELPLVLAALLPEIEACALLLPAARRALSAGLDELLDGEGTPHCRYLTIQHPLVACWTRARMLGASLDGGCWDEDAEAQYRFVVREMLRLSRRDGHSLFAELPVAAGVSASTANFFAAAVKLSGDKKNASALRRFGGAGVPKRKANKDSRAPAAANHSEWGQVAVLRPNWKRSAPQLGIAYGDRSMRAALLSGRDRLFAGDWEFTCRVNEQEATPIGDWEEICWVSDEDVDYLELQIELTGGILVQRQLCLGRRDRFLFIADAVLGNEPRSLRYTLHLPLGAGTSIAAATETREVALHARRPRALLFPLASPEWRVDRRGGELTSGDGMIQLHEAAHATSLYAPLWIDLASKRHARSFTWRQLAVAEERQNVTREVACGYRVQFGKQQWLVYRSLTPARNRTVMGHNLASEFLIARFRRDGSVKTLIEVE
ncbi:MAG: hypothetical protein WD894_13520 [Pirellulales bacterium]